VKGKLASLSAADWLSLAAAPVFALMAVATLLVGDDHLSAVCTQSGGPTALAGMVPMYILMSAFHLSPWLRLTDPRRE
jgi:hypothetical protein